MCIRDSNKLLYTEIHFRYLETYDGPTFTHEVHLRLPGTVLLAQSCVWLFDGVHTMSCRIITQGLKTQCRTPLPFHLRKKNLILVPPPPEPGDVQLHHFPPRHSGSDLPETP
eukprot:TRINITY_DN16929_c0_g2_i1.p1 TRINITY_DN16929_c0_g2~~TRINITY_DN16929_c0_g2_i1.p1  ORF type:complete len:112 (+),score=3.46 TRINITY_DN16929_c0_g2_i1:141-476(+)